MGLNRKAAYRKFDSRKLAQKTAKLAAVPILEYDLQLGNGALTKEFDNNSGAKYARDLPIVAFLTNITCFLLNFVFK
jgi:hypothetical protein